MADGSAITSKLTESTDERRIKTLIYLCPSVLSVRTCIEELQNDAVSDTTEAQ